jgi:hypothetical protein
MPMFVIPDSLFKMINEELDLAIAKCPDAENEREALFDELLTIFSEYGHIPEFTLAKKEKLTC